MKWLFKPERLVLCFGASLIIAVVFILLGAFHRPNLGFWLGNLMAALGVLVKEGIEYYTNHDQVIDFFDFLSWLIGIGFIDCVILFQFIFL